MVAERRLKSVLSHNAKTPKVDPFCKMRRMQRAETIVAETLNHKRGGAWRDLEPSPSEYGDRSIRKTAPAWRTLLLTSVLETDYSPD